MKPLILAAVLVAVPGLSLAQIQGTGAPGTIGPGGQVIPWPTWQFAVMAQQQRMLTASHLRYINQLATLQSRYAANPSVNRR